MRTYICRAGQQAPLRVMVKIDAGALFPLDPRFDLNNHSPTGFNSGYAGSGPAQLALAMCADAFGDDTKALIAYQKFKFAWVQNIQPEAGFEITAKQVRDICYRIMDFREKHPEDVA